MARSKRRALGAQERRELLAAARCTDQTLRRLLHGRPIRQATWLRLREAAEGLGIALNVEPRIAA